MPAPCALTSSMMAVSWSVPMLHRRRSIFRTVLLSSRASRICFPPSGPKLLLVTSMSNTVELVPMRAARERAVRWESSFAPRLRRWREVLDRSTSHSARPPSSPMRFSRRFSASSEWLARSALASARPPSVCTWLSASSSIPITDLESSNFASARTPRSAILLWLRFKCVTDKLSTNPDATIRTFSSSSKLPLRLRYVRVSVRSSAFARDRQSESFIPKRERS
mmetsp:Transcript_37409/g.81455  ORF Transcript_37409/g.81455 Transcript_37409/m.81455 type:complete len:223 (-) Transcript_37409:672-1340(-)